MISKCCAADPPSYESLLPEEKQRFGYLVHRLRKQGVDIKTAQVRAYAQVLAESLQVEMVDRKI